MPLHFGLPEAGTTAKILIHGASSSGKTHLVATSPKPLLVDKEEGYQTLLNVPGFDIRRRVTTDTVEEMNSIFDWIKSNRSKVDTLVIDSLTFLQQARQVELLQDPGRPSKYGKDKLMLEDWGRIAMQMITVMKLAPTIGVHVVCTAQTREREDPVDHVSRWYPFLQGSFEDLVGAYFDVVGYLRLAKGVDGKEVRRLYLKTSTQWYAKDRRGLLPEYMDNPTIPQLLSHMRIETPVASEEVTTPEITIE